MAKIENTTVYPTVLPASNDLLIATDVSNDNATVTFLVSSLTGAGGVAQDLQSVLTTGNTAVEDINLTGNIIVTGMVQPTTIGANNGVGTAGQVLSSTGAGLQWIAAAGATNQSLDQTLTVGNTSSQNIILNSGIFTANGVGSGVAINSAGTLTNAGVSTFTGNVNINSTDLIFNTTGQISAGGSTGTVGQWLVSTGTGLQWSSSIPSASCCPLQSTLLGGNTANNIGIIFTGTSTTSFTANNSITSLGTNSWGGQNTFSGPIILSSTVSDGTTIGTAGQVLSSTGSGVSWITPASSTNTLQQVLDAGNTATGTNALINITGSLTAGTILDTSLSPGGSGQVLTSTGSGLSWLTLGCCSLDEALSIGNFSAQSILLTGASTLTVPTVIPANIQDAGGSTGVNGQVLGISGGVLSWTTPSVVDTTYTYAVPAATSTLRLIDSNGFNQDINLTATAPGITITRNSSSQLTFKNTGTTSLIANTSLLNTTAIVEGCVVANTAGAASTITLLRYNGGSDIGLVPTGGTNTTFLRGDGTWQPSAGLAGFGLQTPVLSTGSPLTGIVNAGNVYLLTPRIYAGTTNPGFVPSGATGATEYLDGSGNWSIPSGGAGGVTTLSLSAGTGQTVPLSGSIVGAILSMTSNKFTGMNRVGFVPDSSIYEQDTNFLRADGAWAIPAGGGGAVTTVTQGSPGTSTGLNTPLNITPTSGAVLVTSNAYSGGSNVGHVPTSAAASQTTTFLRADGTWQVPAGGGGGGGNYIERFTFSAINTNFNASFGFHSFGNILDNGFNTRRSDTLVRVGAPNAPTGWNTLERIGGTVFSNDFINAGVGTCVAGSERSKICSATITIHSNAEHSMEFFLYKINTCLNPTPTLVAIAPLDLTIGKNCGYFGDPDSSPLDITLSGTESLVFCCYGSNNEVSIQGYVTMHTQSIPA